MGAILIAPVGGPTLKHIHLFLHTKQQLGSVIWTLRARQSESFVKRASILCRLTLSKGSVRKVSRRIIKGWEALVGQRHARGRRGTESSQSVFLCCAGFIEPS